MTHKILLGATLLILLGCLVVSLIVINTGITVPRQAVPTVSGQVGWSGRIG